MNRLRRTCLPRAQTSKTQTPRAPARGRWPRCKRRGDGIRGTTRLCRVLADATSAADVDSARLDYGSRPAEPTQTIGSLGQLLQGDLRRCSGRGSHRPPLARAFTLRLLGPFSAFRLEFRSSTNVGTGRRHRSLRICPIGSLRAQNRALYASMACAEPPVSPSLPRACLPSLVTLMIDNVSSSRRPPLRR